MSSETKTLKPNNFLSPAALANNEKAQASISENSDGVTAASLEQQHAIK